MRLLREALTGAIPIAVAYVCIHAASGIACKSMRSYQNLRPEEKHKWCSRFCSTIHAIVLTSSAFWYLSEFDVDFDPVTSQSDVLDMVWINSLGYCIYAAALWASQARKLGALYVIRHVMFAFAVLFELLTNYNLWMASLLLLTEAATPYLNFRWWMVKMEMRKTRLFCINTVVLYVTFLLGRVISPTIFCFYQFAILSTYHNQLQTSSCLILSVAPPLYTTLSIYRFTRVHRTVRSYFKDSYFLDSEPATRFMTLPRTWSHSSDMSSYS
eukprot:Rmarinus@m.13055